MRDVDGRPIAGATVVATLQPESRDPDAPAYDTSPPVHTDAQGRFLVGSLEPARYGVTASAPGFAAAFRGPVSLEPGGNTEGVDLVLARGGVTLSGHVLDAGGGAIPGAWVRAMFQDGPATEVRLFVSGPTDATGAYALSLGPGSYDLGAAASGYGSRRAWVSLGGSATFDFRLQPAASIAGRVVEQATGRPVEGASVRAWVRDEFNLAPTTKESRTDPEGRFRLVDCEPGRYEVEARKGALLGRAVGQVAVASGAAASGVVIALLSGHSLSGRVLDGTGRGLAGARVQARVTNVTGVAEPTTAMSGPSGAFRFDGLAPGKFWVLAEAEGTVPAQKLATMAEADVDGFDLTLGEGGAVTGTVTAPDGTPVAGASVEVHAEMSASGWSRADGRFSITGLPPGPILVTASHPSQGHGAAPPTTLAASEIRQIDVCLQRASISGRVTWEDGKPAAGIGVKVMSDRYKGGQTTSGADGRYTVALLEAGDNHVRAFRGSDGWPSFQRAGPPDRADLTVTLSADEQRSDVDLVVYRTDLSIAGLVVDPEGRPVTGAAVGATPGIRGRDLRTTAMPGDRSSTDTDATGAFTVSGLRAGDYDVWADVPGFPEARAFPVAAGATNVRLRLERPALLAGTVVDGAGLPVAVCTVHAWPAPRAGAEQEERRSLLYTQGSGLAEVLNAAGAFAISGLRAGAWKVTAFAPDGREGWMDAIVVQPGEEKRGLRVEVRLRKPDTGSDAAPGP